MFSIDQKGPEFAYHRGSAAVIKNFHLVNNITQSDSTNPYSNIKISDITPVLTGKRMRSLKASRLIYGNGTFDQADDSRLVYKT